MRAWARMHGKSVRQRNVRQDNTMDRVGTLPLNLYEKESLLKPLDLNEVFKRVVGEPLQANNSTALEPTDGSSSLNNEELLSERNDERTEQEDSFSASDTDSDSEEDADDALATALSMVRPTRLRKIETTHKPHGGRLSAIRDMITGKVVGKG